MKKKIVLSCHLEVTVGKPANIPVVEGTVLLCKVEGTVPLCNGEGSIPLCRAAFLLSEE